MGKIKKFDELTFSSDMTKSECSEIKGGAIGCDYDNCGSYDYLDHDRRPWTGTIIATPTPTTRPDSCKCGCSGCSYEDGGAGFALGMALNRVDGHDCTWFSIF